MRRLTFRGTSALRSPRPERVMGPDRTPRAVDPSDPRLASARAAQARLDDAMGAVVADGVTAWYHRRVQFARAHAVRTALCAGGAFDGREPVVYAVKLRGHVGAAYIGETIGRRRLWDLPVGESHHLATTFPVMTWDRIVVIRWTAWAGGSPPSDPVDLKLAGLAIESHLHLGMRPELNLWTKRSNGSWAPRNPRPRSGPADFDAASVSARVRAALEELLERSFDGPAHDDPKLAARIVRPACCAIEPHLDLSGGPLADDHRPSPPG